MSRRERERERNRQDILQAALRVFARNGYYAATIEEIAREAEFAIGTLYNLFKGKEDIFVRIVENVVREFEQAFVAQVMSVEDPEQAIRALIRLRLTHFNAHRDFIRVVLEAQPGHRIDPARLLPPHLRDVHGRLIEAIAGIFKRGIEQGVFEDEDPLCLTLCLEGITNAFVTYWARNETSEPLENRIEMLQRAILKRFKLQRKETPHA